MRLFSKHPPLIIFTVFLAFLTPLYADVTFKDAWIRPSAGPNAALFITLVNTSKNPQKLTHAHIGGCQSVELHAHVHKNNIAQMVQVRAINIPAFGETELKPGDQHIMLMHLQSPLKEGDQVPVILVFETGKTLELIAPVKISKGECCSSLPNK